MTNPENDVKRMLAAIAIGLMAVGCGDDASESTAPVRSNSETLHVPIPEGTQASMEKAMGAFKKVKLDDEVMAKLLASYEAALKNADNPATAMSAVLQEGGFNAASYSFAFSKWRCGSTGRQTPRGRRPKGLGANGQVNCRSTRAHRGGFGRRT